MLLYNFIILCCSFGVHHHQFADDTQINLALRSSDIQKGLALLADCTAAVKHWGLANGLLLNGDKLQAICLGMFSQLRAAYNHRCWYFVADQWGDMLAQCDYRLALDIPKPHISSRQLLHLPSTGISAYLSSAAILHCSNIGLYCLILSRLDYCNAVLYRCSARAMVDYGWHHVQNYAARVVTQSHWYTPSMHNCYSRYTGCQCSGDLFTSQHLSHTKT